MPMLFSSRKESLVLFLGDVLIFYISLILGLLVRYGQWPGWDTFSDYFLLPFTILFVVWILVFLIAGLYEKHTSLLKSRLPSIILNAQLANSAIAALFFYLIPYFGITPKTTLFIVLVISFGLILLWRLYGYSALAPVRKEKGLILGTGTEMEDLYQEVNNNSLYDLTFISSIDLNDIDKIDFQEEVVRRVYSEQVSVIAIDLKSDKVEPVLPHLYNLIFSDVRFIDMHKIYEDIFDRIPLSLVRYNWFMENISIAPGIVYDFLKRLMDVAVSVVLGIIAIPFCIVAALAIKLDDGGDVLYIHERVGRKNRIIKMIKFRSMTKAQPGEDQKITKIGLFLRKSRIDELPQLWNVFVGDLSLVGPRPELPHLVKLYEEEIPYYNIRHLIKPGLSGWAQLHQSNPPKFKVDFSETKTKLSYDLYYIKNRSLMLDIKVGLRTIAVLLSRTGI